MRNSIFFKFLLLVVGNALFISCDKDYNEVGDALIGENHFDLTKDIESSVQSTWKKTGAIASNNLDINALGVLDNSVFGQTTANFATQVQLASVNPTIDSNLAQKVQSVTLYIPYFTNKNVGTGTDGRPVYVLDSIYGNKDSKIKLSIYENKYLLGTENKEPEPAPILDPNYPQLYYTNDSDKIPNNPTGQLLNNSVDAKQNDEFVFSPNEYKIVTPASGSTAEKTTYIAPGMRLDLDKAFFEDLLFDKSNPDYDLSSNAVFEKYFKGLYFNVEKVSAEGVLAMLNFKKGTITVNYKEKAVATDADVSVEKSIVLNLTGNTVNLLNNGIAGGGYDSAPSSDRIYLRGGEGSVGEINLFNPSVDVVKYNRTTKEIESGANGIPDELDNIKYKGWLINEASLTFYVDQTAMTNVAEPNRIYLYDVTNKVPIMDYYYDGTSSISPNYQKRVLGGIIEKDADGRGLRYKIKITNYIRDLVNKDFTNVKLGVSVTQAITNATFKKVKDSPAPYEVWKALTPQQKNPYHYPTSSVMSPLGTILYGSNETDDTKKLKLEIYYTKPN